MTRAEILAQYEVRNGIIRTPGMFEGERIYVPYFWDAFLNGLADNDHEDTLFFNVTAEDRAEFPELRRRKVIRLFQRNDGFVCED